MASQAFITRLSRLLKLHAVGVDFRQAGARSGLHGHTLIHEVAAHQLQNFPDHFN